MSVSMRAEQHLWNGVLLCLSRTNLRRRQYLSFGGDQQHHLPVRVNFMGRAASPLLLVARWTPSRHVWTNLGRACFNLGFINIFSLSVFTRQQETCKRWPVCGTSSWALFHGMFKYFRIQFSHLEWQQILEKSKLGRKSSATLKIFTSRFLNIYSYKI